MATTREITLILLSIVYVFLGLLSLRYGFMIPSYMQRLKAKGINPARRFPRILFFMWAAVLIYAGIKTILLVL
jgi:hypothetical protein